MKMILGCLIAIFSFSLFLAAGETLTKKENDKKIEEKDKIWYTKEAIKINENSDKLENKGSNLFKLEKDGSQIIELIPENQAAIAVAQIELQAAIDGIEKAKNVAMEKQQIRDRIASKILKELNCLECVVSTKDGRMILIKPPVAIFNTDHIIKDKDKEILNGK